jgi:hypothetical protein
MSESDNVLLQAYYYSQITMPIITIGAVFAAFRAAWSARRQATLFRVFELMKHIEDDRVRQARRIVMTTIAGKVELTPTGRWWDDPSLEKEAAMLCSSYDHLGSVFAHFPSSEVERFFLNRWGETAIKCRKILDSYLGYRKTELKSPKAYWGFDEFCKQAKKIHPTI